MTPFEKAEKLLYDYGFLCEKAVSGPVKLFLKGECFDRLYKLVIEGEK